MLQHSAGLCTGLLGSIPSRCSRSIWVAAAVAAEGLAPSVAASSSAAAQQVAALHSTASSSESDTASITQLQDTPLLQQQSAQVVQQQPAQEGMSSLHSQVLFQLPPHGQPLPNLPRFRPRKAESKPVPLQAALQLIKKSGSSSHTVEAHLRLKVDPRRGDQMVRGAAVLPHSWQTGLRIAVFAEGAAAEEARAAGADIIGSEALVSSILSSKGKSIDFTACLATPDMMPQLVKLGRILGPKGLMPNPKMGTLTNNLSGAIAELRQGRVEFKMDRTGIIHAPIGKVGFEPQALLLNMGALTAALMAVKPEAIKGGLVKFVRSVHLASTMGPSVQVDVVSLSDAMQEAAAAMKARAAHV